MLFIHPSSLRPHPLLVTWSLHSLSSTYNGRETIYDARSAHREGLSDRLYVAYLSRLLRADERALRPADQYAGTGDAGRLYLHEHAAQAARRRKATLHRRGLRVRREDISS